MTVTKLACSLIFSRQRHTILLDGHWGLSGLLCKRQRACSLDLNALALLVLLLLLTLLTLLLLLCLLFATCCCHSYSHSRVLGRLLMALQISDPSCESWYLNTVTSSCTFS